MIGGWSSSDAPVNSTGTTRLVGVQLAVDRERGELVTGQHPLDRRPRHS